MAILSTVLSGTISNVYVSSGNSVVSVMYFCNTGGTAVNLNVYAVPNGSASANTTVQIYKDIQIAGNDTFVVDMEKLVLANGDMIRANASASTTATVSYVGI